MIFYKIQAQNQRITGGLHMKLAICDDEILELKHLETQIKSYADMHPEQMINHASFQSSAELLPRIREGSYDIYLLDIIMDGDNGIAVGNAIRKVDDKAIIIYTTSSPDYAIECYDVAAFSYLVKPIKDQRLFEILDKAARRIPQKAEGHLSIRTAEGNKSVLKSKIVYIEYYSHYFSCYLEDGTHITSLSFRESFDQIAKPVLETVLFQKASSSFIVNLAQVEKITKKGFLMKNGEEITVTRRYSDTKKKFTQYIMRGDK